jgi:hypothetical protein
MSFTVKLGEAELIRVVSGPDFFFAGAFFARGFLAAFFTAFFFAAI